MGQEMRLHSGSGRLKRFFINSVALTCDQNQVFSPFRCDSANPAFS